MKWVLAYRQRLGGYRVNAGFKMMREKKIKKNKKIIGNNKKKDDEGKDSGCFTYAFQH